MSSLVKLTCCVQKYAWGQPAAASLVAKFVGKSEDDDNYAELWMGTHPKGPAEITETGQKLHTWISENPTVRLGVIGDQFGGIEGGNLPFLLKILSVNKALSIQAHPTKEHAALLHSTLPQHYPDTNHKPEMAIALTVFEGLCGFRPVEEILEEITNHDELHPHLSQDLRENIETKLSGKTADEISSFISVLFKELLVLENSAKMIFDQISGENFKKSKSDELFLRIHAQHPGDRGLVCIYLLNHVTLQPGEAMYLGANKIHAYFSGNCVECMACSDNTVRAGLTGKFVDVDTLTQMLEFEPQTAESQKLPVKVCGDVTSYLPPVKDFAVDKIVTKNDPIYKYPASLPTEIAANVSPQVILCVEGEGSISVGDETVAMKPGVVCFVVPNVSFKAAGCMSLFAAYAQVE